MTLLAVQRRDRNAIDAVDHVNWPVAVREMDWRQGEHITLIGPTGAGKTELIVNIARERTWEVFLATKRVDKTQHELHKLTGFRTITAAPELNPEIGRRFIFKPPWPRNATSAQVKAAHAQAFRSILHRAFYQTGWTVIVDEGRYIAKRLGLQDELELFWLQGRSQGNSLITATQRPRFIPLEAYDQASHLFLWRDNDTANIARVAEMAGVNRKTVIDIVPSLGRHDVLYVQPFTGDMFITNTRWR